MFTQRAGQRAAGTAPGDSDASVEAGKSRASSLSRIVSPHLLLIGASAALCLALTACGGSSHPKPTVTISANPASITLGGSSTLTWSSANATSCTASGAWSGSQKTSGTITETPSAAGTDTYTLTCTGAGGSGSGSATVTVGAPPAPTVTIAVSPATITLGASATLTWSSTNATSCTASGAWSGSQSTSGTATETPTAAGTDTYTLTCAGSGGSSKNAATLTVNAPPAPTALISVSPTPITLGASATLTWSSTSATSCTASGAWSGTQATSGSQSVTPTAAGSDSYEITCTGAGGSASSTAVLTVNNPAPAVTISISPTTITAGGSAMLSWSVTNATSCTASGAWSGAEPTSGMATETPLQAGTDTYTLACTGAGGSDTESATLTVTAPPSSAFVYTVDGDNTVSGFGEAQGTGQLTLLANSPFSPGVTNTDAILADPALNLLFVAGSTSNTNGTIASFTVDPSTGNLTPTGNITSTPDKPQSDGMALGPNGKYLYITGDYATLLAYSIASDGSLTALPGSPYSVPCIGAFCGNDNDPQEMVYDAADTTLYIVNVQDWTVATYSVASDGSLTYITNTTTSEISPSDADVPDGLTISPNGKFLYVTNGDSNNVSAFTITPGATSGGNPEPLTYIAGTPFANTGGSNPLSPAIEATGHYLYVNNYDAETISAFSIDQTSGALTEIGSPVSIQAAAGQNFQLAIDPTGSYLYVANAGGKGNIPAFSIDPSTGALTPLAGSPFAMGSGVTSGPSHIAIFQPTP